MVSAVPIAIGHPAGTRVQTVSQQTATAARPHRYRRSGSSTLSTSMFTAVSAWLRGFVRAGTRGVAATMRVDPATRTEELMLLCATAVALLLLRPVLAPDSAVMRLALPATAITLPQETGREALFSAFQPDRHDREAAHEGSPVDLSRFQRLEIREYRLAPGDTLSGLAQRNGLRIDTLASLNQISDARRIRVGDTFRIPNRDGVLHTVARGDALSSIASRYGTTVNSLLDANDLSSSSLTVGQTLFVPEARMNRTDLQRVLGELFIYPVVNGRFTSGFGMRNDPFTGIRRFHNGIDLAGPIGMPVRAARAGRVVHVESQMGNYGKFVIVRHDGGYQTLYAHLDSFSVRVGQNVNQGQQIGTLGNTGRSTGPHVHFSVIRNGSFVDPMRYLQ